MAQTRGDRKKRNPREAESGQLHAGGGRAAPPPRHEENTPAGGRRAGRSRTWMLAAAVPLLAAAGVFGLRLLGARGPAGRSSPIVLISIDTLRADRLPTYGYGKIRTPAIDELANGGNVFENCYTQVPLTLPSHASLFTGVLPSVHGVRDNLGFKVAAGTRTLAAELKQAGYATGGAVSAYVLHSTTGISQGFEWYDDEYKAVGPETPLTDIRRDGMETLDRALSWLGQRSGSRTPRPIFLFLHIYEPHAPYTPPARYRQGGTAPYDGTVMYSDEIVGRLFEGLRKLGLYDASLIVLLSDHGEGLDDHGEATHGVFLYREVMRVPLIVKLPGAPEGGQRIQAPVQLIDIAPTILDLAGLPPDPHMQGKSLVPAVRGREFPGDRQVYGESLYGRLHFGWKELFSLTGPQYSFILAPREELYDIRQDPGERHNLLSGASATPAAARLTGPVAAAYERLREELARYAGQLRPAAPSAVEEEQLKKLRALGYVGSPTLDATGGTAAPDPKDRIGDLALYQQAMRMKSVLMFAKAADTLRNVLQTSPRMIDAWDQLGEAEQRLGRFAEAADALRQSLAIAPQRTAQRFELVDLLVQLRRFDEARGELRLAARQEPDEAEARLALLEVGAGRSAAAREAAARAAQGLPAAIPFTEGVLLYEKQEYAKALPLFQKAFEGLQGRAPNALPYIHFFLGDALAREGGTAQDPAARARLLQEAEQHLKTELTLKPSDAAAATSLCFVHALEHSLQKVDQGLNEFARQNPSASTYQLIARLYGNMNLNDRAAQWSERARRAETEPSRAR